MIELLQASIQEALSEYGPTITAASIPYPDLNDYLNELSRHIDEKSNKINANITGILETLTSDAIPPPTTFNLDHLKGLVLDNNDLSSLWGQVDGTMWMQEVSNEVTSIEGWEDNAKTLSLLVMSDFETRRKSYSDIDNSALDAMFEMHNKGGDNEVIDTPDIDSIWNGVYAEKHRISPEESLDVIKNTPLKSYMLSRDNQRNVIINEKERKTRRHIGVIDGGELYQHLSMNGFVDPSSIFSYNVGAVSHLAMQHEILSSKLEASSLAFFDQDSPLQSKVRQLKESFQNPKQLAIDVAVLEVEEGLTRVELMKQRLVHAIYTNATRSRQFYMETSHAAKDVSSERMNIIQNEYKSSREDHLDSIGASLDAILTYLSALDDLKGIYNATSRDLLELIEESEIESTVSQEVIQAEAEVERSNEVMSMNQIKVIGDARIEETKEFVANVFRNLASCFHHIVGTASGRQQFVFYICLAASLALALSTIKEIIALACSMLLKLFITPRLVREYGNLRFRVSWPRMSKSETNKLDSIFLPTSIKERLEKVTKAASFARERHLPLRSILLHGSAGCGKSVTAKAIAQSIPNLPYALMSGADISPLGNQGPAELRRLLSWANKHGGIIIIDEAESALGKRGKSMMTQEDEQKQQQDFSRDCLNVLLSLTGSIGNIMLIITTTNPGELDDAILDRMDEIIHLPPLDVTERTGLLQRHFSQLFEAEETIAPTSFTERISHFFRHSPIRAHYDGNFEVKRSISELANVAEMKSFSGREIVKLLQGIAYKTFASEEGVMNQSLWDRETRKLIDLFASKHKQGRSIEFNGRLRRTIKHEIETVKAKKRNRIVYKPIASPGTNEDDENGLGYNDFFLGRHKAKAKKRGADDLARKGSTRRGSSNVNYSTHGSTTTTSHVREPLQDITPP